MSKTTEDQPVPSKSHGIYFLPNLLTTSALFFGFYGIVAAMKGLFEYAAIAIFIAIIMDGLDGRVARLTGTQSLFGAQYDSLSDMVCFGIAPALVIYQWGLSGLGKIGWLAAFVYTASTALRLARFNAQWQTTDPRFFTGIPCPPAAALIASMVWLGTDYNFEGKKIDYLIVIITFMMGILMISRVPYHSFKEIDLKNKVPFVVALVLLFIVTILAWDPPKVLFLVSSVYALSGPFFWFKLKFNQKKKS